MISTGNDIVALKCDNASRAGQEKFYSKIITQAEFDLYSIGKSDKLTFESYIWLLWSIKEAVYKYQKRINPAFVFSPKKITIQAIDSPINQSAINFGEGELGGILTDTADCYTCKIKSGTGVFYALSKVYSDVVHTVVSNTKDFTNIYWGIKHIENTTYEAQSKSVRSFILNTLSTVFPNDDLLITKSDIGFPVLVKNLKEVHLLISFAHHENFVGYSFLLEKESLKIS